MIKTLRIGDQEYKARPSALTDVIYRNVFGKDLKIALSKIRAEKTADTSLFKELAFVMIWQAMPREKRIGEAMKELSIETYYEWLDEIDEAGFMKAETLASITNVWLSTQTTTIDIKNLTSPQ